MLRDVLKCIVYRRYVQHFTYLVDRYLCRECACGYEPRETPQPLLPRTIFYVWWVVPDGGYA